MKKWLNKNIQKFDIIHLHTFRAYQNNIIQNYSKKYNIPYILQAHGSLLTFFQKSKLKKIYDLLWGHELLKDASKLIALTESEFGQYQQMGVPENKIEIVPNGINLLNYQNLPEKGEFKKKYNISNDVIVLLYLGRLHKSKGIDLLMESFAKLLLEYKKVKLVIVGPDDGFLPYLKLKAEKLKIDDKTLFTGPLYGNDKMEAYIDSNVFVTPSFSGFPITFLESCICGTPIVTTNKMEEITWIDNKVGFVVEYDSEKILRAIVKILNENLIEEFEYNSKKIIEERFDESIVIEKLEKIYNKLISN
jgi:glycosyltransferase involved in cell wall biosynthesis